MQKIISKYENIILLIIGVLLIVLSVYLILYDKIELIKSNVFDEVELLKYEENNRDKDDSTSDEEYIEDAETDFVDDESKVKSGGSSSSNKAKETIGYLEIKKINLKQALFSKKSYYNNVNRGIQILSASDYPDEEEGNLILASHSGTSSISYFKNLYKLEIGDEAKVYYKNNVYTYKIASIYNVPKNGKVYVNRDRKKNTLTLITCTKNSKTEQTVYILYLENKEGV